MKCPVCDNTMKHLFYSAYCSHCENNETKHYTGFIAFYKDAFLNLKQNQIPIGASGDLIFPSFEETSQFAIKHVIGNQKFIIAKVISSKEFDPKTYYYFVENPPKKDNEIKITKIFEE